MRRGVHSRRNISVKKKKAVRLHHNTVNDFLARIDTTSVSNRNSTDIYYA